MACGFAKARQHGYIIPEPEHYYPDANFGQAILKNADVSALAGTINA